MFLVIAEKPSVAMALAKVIGAGKWSISSVLPMPEGKEN